MQADNGHPREIPDPPTRRDTPTARDREAAREFTLRRGLADTDGRPHNALRR